MLSSLPSVREQARPTPACAHRLHNIQLQCLFQSKKAKALHHRKLFNIGGSSWHVQSLCMYLCLELCVKAFQELSQRGARCLRLANPGAQQAKRLSNGARLGLLHQLLQSTEVQVLVAKLDQICLSCCGLYSLCDNYHSIWNKRNVMWNTSVQVCSNLQFLIRRQGRILER